MRSIRTLLAVFITLFLAGFMLVGSSGSASAVSSATAKESYYRYWAYFTVKDGRFVYQETQGPGTYVPADGSIEGYRFVSSGLKMKHAPRADLAKVTFDAVCGDVKAADGKKRVAVLIDYGVESDAAKGAVVPEPAAYCAQVPTKAKGIKVLRAVAEIRPGQAGSLCAISGYPASGCFDQVDSPTPADSGPVAFDLGSDKATSDKNEDSNVPLLLGIGAAVVLLGAGGVVMARRNKSA